MPDEIYGVMAVKNGQKQTIMNLSNARQKSYADLQTMTDAQKKGVIVCPDYPKEEFLVQADQVGYGGGTVKDALDDSPRFVDYSSPQSAFDVNVTRTQATLYTVPRDCYLRIACVSTSNYNANIVRCLINGTIVSSVRGGEADIFVPVRKNDVLTGYADLDTGGRIIGYIFDFA